MKKTLLILSILLVFFLAACGGSSGNSQISTSDNNGSTNNSAVEPVKSESQSQTADDFKLSDDFAGALTIQAQLALGTVKLEDTAEAVNETQASELLPLWQALQTLNQSDTTADIELQAVLNSISDTMTPEQLAAISEMHLTEETLTTLMESGDLGFSRGGPGSGENGQRGFGGGGGFPGGGPGGFPGGGPGGFPGGGPGGNLSEDDIATRQAQFAANGPALIQDRLLTGMVTRLLQDKMGIVSEGAQRADVINKAFTAVADAAGLTVEELQAQMSEDQTMAAIVQDHGGDVELLQTTLLEIFKALPNAGDLDLEQSISDWLGLE